MALHSSTLAWKIPWAEELGRLQSMGSWRVGHNGATSLSLFTFMHWRRKWQPTPLFLPGDSQGGGAWWAPVYGVAQSRTWLKRLSSSSSIEHISILSAVLIPEVFLNIILSFDFCVGSYLRWLVSWWSVSSEPLELHWGQKCFPGLWEHCQREPFNQIWNLKGFESVDIINIVPNPIWMEGFFVCLFVCFCQFYSKIFSGRYLHWFSLLGDFSLLPNKVSSLKGFQNFVSYKKNFLTWFWPFYHSSTLVWKIPWMEESGRLQTMRLLRVRHDWATSLSLFTFMHWRRKWQPTPVFLPGESQGWGSLVGFHLWGRT